MTNIFPFCFENKSILSLKKSNPHHATQFHEQIDDLFEINGNSLFEKHFKEAYPEEQELGLKKGSASIITLHFLILT